MHINILTCGNSFNHIRCYSHSAPQYFTCVRYDACQHDSGVYKSTPLQILCNDTSPSNGAIIRILRSLMDIKPHLEHNGHLSQQITTFKLGGFRNQRIRIICSIKNISSLQGYIAFICPVKN